MSFKNLVKKQLRRKDAGTTNNSNNSSSNTNQGEKTLQKILKFKKKTKKIVLLKFLVIES